jgi:hypothetical protein
MHTHGTNYIYIYIMFIQMAYLNSTSGTSIMFLKKYSIYMAFYNKIAHDLLLKKGIA